MTLLLLFIITVFIELLTARIIAWKKTGYLNTWNEINIAILGANLISFPAAWYLFSYLQLQYDSQQALLITEIIVIAIETLLLRLQLSGSLKNSAIMSFCINGVSAAIGVLLWVLFVNAS